MDSPGLNRKRLRDRQINSQIGSLYRINIGGQIESKERESDLERNTGIDRCMRDKKRKDRQKKRETER